MSRLFLEPAWTHKIVGELSDYNPTEEGVIGDFELALSQLIISLKERGHHDLLREWDHTRGNDWYTQTGKGLHGSYQED